MSLRIERYTMALSFELTLGEAKEIYVKDWTSCTFEPRRIIANAPCLGFVDLNEARVDNIDVLLNEDGSERFESHDAYYFFNEGAGRMIKPVLCEHGLGMRVKYRGLLPDRRMMGAPFLFCLSFIGPAGESLKRNGVES